MRRCESMAIRRENFETLTRVARGRLGVQKAGFDHYFFRLTTQHAEMISHRVQGSEAFIGGARSPLPRGGHQGSIGEIGHGVFLCLSGFEAWALREAASREAALEKLIRGYESRDSCGSAFPLGRLRYKARVPRILNAMPGRISPRRSLLLGRRKLR